MEQRVAEIADIRLQGATFLNAKEFIRERECAPVAEGETPSPWLLPERGKPLSDGQIWRYIAKADRLNSSGIRASRKKNQRLHKARRWYLYARAVEQGDVRAALSVLDSLAKLDGLLDAEAVEQLETMRKQIAELTHALDGLAATAPGHAGPANGSVRPR
jgi:hypothetical protein